MPPDPPPDPSRPPSDVPPSESPLPFPAFSHPMHGLYHPSQTMFAAMAVAERTRGEYLPNPLAWAHWDDWYRKLALEAEEQRKASLPPPLFGETDEDKEGSRPSSRGSWNSFEEPQARLDAPLPMPADLPFPLEAITGLQAAGSEGTPAPLYTLPPPLPRATSRRRLEIQPDEQTVTYGSNAEYYGGSNMEFISSADLVPWHVKSQRERSKNAGQGKKMRIREAWAHGRGSRRHMMVFESIADESSGGDGGDGGDGDDEEERRRRRRRGSDAS